MVVTTKALVEPPVDAVLSRHVARLFDLAAATRRSVLSSKASDVRGAFHKYLLEVLSTSLVARELENE